MIFFPRILYHGAWLVALTLVAAVLVAPGLDLGDPTWDPVWRLFAEDEVVRRTALASAAGLVVTALVFFRPALMRARAARLRKPPPGDLAGA